MLDKSIIGNRYTQIVLLRVSIIDIHNTVSTLFQSKLYDYFETKCLLNKYITFNSEITRKSDGQKE